MTRLRDIFKDRHEAAATRKLLKATNLEPYLL